MEAPYRVPADAERIAQLARIAATPVYRSLPRGAGREQLGLDPERVRLTLNGLVLRFGDLDPIAQHRYVAIADQVHLIGDALYYHLLASPEDYVDRRLLPTGFRAASGSLDGKPLTSEQLAGLEGLSAEAVEPLGSELVGRLLSLTSPDGLVWSRLDLRLRYRLTTPPSWAVAEAAVGPEGEVPEKGKLDW
jgi:hypothetical protein